LGVLLGVLGRSLDGRTLPCEGKELKMVGPLDDFEDEDDEEEEEYVSGENLPV